MRPVGEVLLGAGLVNQLPEEGEQRRSGPVGLQRLARLDDQLLQVVYATG